MGLRALLCVSLYPILLSIFRMRGNAKPLMRCLPWSVISCVCRGYVSVLLISALRSNVLARMVISRRLKGFPRSTRRMFRAFCIRAADALCPFSEMSIFPSIMPVGPICNIGVRDCLILRCSFSRTMIFTFPRWVIVVLELVTML